MIHTHIHIHGLFSYSCYLTDGISSWISPGKVTLCYQKMGNHSLDSEYKQDTIGTLRGPSIKSQTRWKWESFSRFLYGILIVKSVGTKARLWWECLLSLNGR